MRAAYQAVVLPPDRSLKIMYTVGQVFTSWWHFHPEIELMHVVRSRGLRFVGDSVEPFREGDLVMVGSNLPHMWQSPALPTPHDYAQGVIVLFRDILLEGALLRTPELASIAKLIERSQRGIHFYGDTAREAAERIRRLPQTIGGAHDTAEGRRLKRQVRRHWLNNDVDRLLHFVALLDFLARAKEQRLISSAGYVPNLNRTDAERIRAVCAYVNEHLTDEIEQPKAAALAHLTPTSFSVFFRRKMGSTFPLYVNRLRIAWAIHLMVEDGMSVTDACFASGFNNLANFNRRFLEIRGVSPRNFLRQFVDHAGK